MLLTLLLFLAGTLFGELRICVKCGYEAQSGALKCAHCSAELPPEKVETEKDESPAVPETETGSGGYISVDFVKKEIEKGQKALEQKNYALAVYFFKNAAALNYLAKPDSANRFAERIASLITNAQDKVRKVSRTCKACQGTGKATVYMRGLSKSGSDLSGEGSRKKIAATFKQCAVCGGTGSVLQNASIESLQGIYGRALGQYRTLQKTQRLTQTGEAWVDPEVAKLLTLEQEIMLRKAVAAPCEDCLGTGYQDCRKCEGIGKIKCNASGCMDGLVETESGGGLDGGTKLNRMQKCSICYGKGYIICEECNGTGGKACKSCKGSGERDMCSKCGGEGLAKCRKCNGTGKDKDGPCVECNEKGIVRCPSCNGDGKRD